MKRNNDMDKMLIIVTDFSKQSNLKYLNTKKLELIANNSDYDADIIVATNNFDSKETASKEADITVDRVNIYTKNVNYNQIVSELQSDAENYARVFVLDANYLSEMPAIEEMIKRTRSTDANIEHAENKSTTVWGQLRSLIIVIYNYFLKLFLGAHDPCYLVRFCIYDRNVLEMMKRFPQKSATFRETNFLSAVTINSVVIDGHCTNAVVNRSLTRLIFGLSMLALFIANFIVLIAVPMNLNLILWLIISLCFLLFLSMFSMCYCYLFNKIK